MNSKEFNKEDLFAGLNDEEKKLVFKILTEFGEQGESKTYNDLLMLDYKETPVDILTFVTDDNLLGKAWKDVNGNSKLYEFWSNELKDIFPDNVTTNYDTLLESGARGIGKSEIACGVIAPYLMYRVMCMRNPREFYHLKSTEKIAFAFLNIKLDLAEAICQDKFQKTIQMSPWFMSKGTMTQRNNQPYWTPPEPLELIIGSQSDDVIGRPIFFAFFDEISFLKNKDVEEQKKKAKNMIDTAKGGMKTRFIYHGKNPTLLCVASSKRSEQSFMESYIRDLGADDNVKIIDKPVWEVKPKGTYSDKTFWVGIGDKFHENIFIPKNDYDKLYLYEQRNYKLLAVPIDFEKDARNGLEKVLCDFAGISSFSTNKFLRAERVSEVCFNDISNPFPDIIECGNAKEDTSQYKDWFDVDKLDKRYLTKPLFIHLDMSVSGDKTGIAGVWIIGKKANEDGTAGKDLVFQTAFSTSIKAPTGRQISFAKTREFIRWLKRELDLKIKRITFDTFQSYDTGQQLQDEGFETEILSVDRVETPPGEKVGICKPYQYLKNTIYEGRIRFYSNMKSDGQSSTLWYTEFTQLEKNENTGKIDHPDKGCFTGDTKVSLVDGRELTFLELVDEFNQGKKNYVYSINPDTLKIEPRLIEKAWCTKKNAKLVEVTLDNGEKIRCTPNHRFMLRNGEYCEAQDLQSNDSLMPLYRKVSDKGLKDYRMYYEPVEDKWHYEHRQFAKDVLDEKYLVHHKDFNKLNNSPDNLLWMSKEEHHRIHSITNTGAYSEEANRKRKETLSNYFANNKDNSSIINRNKKISETLTDQVKKEERQKWIDLLESTFNVKYNELSMKDKCKYGVKLSIKLHPEARESVNNKISINHHLGKYDNAHTSLQECNEKNKKLKLLFPTIDREKFVELFGFEYDDLDSSHKGVWSNRYRQRMYELVNHKVVSVKTLDECEDVYDITVEHNHNFALSCGIFVHNSKDQADAICGATYTASKYASEYDFDYGENYEQILLANEDTAESQLKQMTVSFEEELRKLGPQLTPKKHDVDEGKSAFLKYDDILIY